MSKTLLTFVDQDGDQVVIRLDQIVLMHSHQGTSTKINLTAGHYVIIDRPIQQILEAVDEACKPQLPPARDGDKYLQECIQTYGMLCGMQVKGEVDMPQVEEAWDAILVALGVMEALNDEP